MPKALFTGTIKTNKKREENKTMDKKLIEKIKDIVEDHLSNTEINKIELCEDTHDHYLLGKWDLAQEINDVLILTTYDNKQVNKYMNKREVA